MSATLDLHDNVAVLVLGDDENRFSPGLLDTIDRLLDEVEAAGRPLVTIGGGKFYSNGLDLEWLLAHGDEADAYVGRIHDLLRRLVTFPTPTVAAVNGHAFGAGAMLAVAHDYRIMRDDRGYLCFPEVDIDIPFTPGMAALIQAKLTPDTALTAMTTGHRYTAGEALSAALIADAAPIDRLLGEAVGKAAALAGKNPITLGAIKATMYAQVADALQRPSAH